MAPMSVSSVVSRGTTAVLSFALGRAAGFQGPAKSKESMEHSELHCKQSSSALAQESWQPDPF